ncbi:MAG: MATE family efflux transporter [Bacteroidales bacterium]|nr:MATE family efflux transporter [Bacteroidales bacterium]MDD4671929.1 MATE family efflux transporter [Bacteroidales bacterium]MDY0348536.1 MATE family efflux transporter [Tenuifilaceae bacterium]
MEAQHDNIKLLADAPIRKVLWKFFVPAFTGVVVNSLYNIVDRIFVGQGVGALALTGLSVVFPIMIIMMAFSMLIGIGAGVRISIHLGKKQYNLAERVLGNAFILLIIISIVMAGVGFLIKDPLLRMFGAGPDTVGYANDYLNIILLGVTFNMVGFSLNNIIRSEGNAKIAMYSMLISAGTNIVLDPIFIFALGMGVKGAAVATIISQFILCIWVIRHFRSTNSVVKLKAKYFPIKWGVVVSIISIGFSPFSMQLASSVVHGLFNVQLIKYGGDLAVGAMGIINSISMLVVMTIIAINMASQPIYGFNYGAGNYVRVKQTLFLSLKAAVLISIGGFLVMELFPGFFIKIFNSSDAELLKIGKRGLRIFMMALPIIGFQIVAGNFFQSTGKAIISAFISLLRQVIVLIPILLILPPIWGLTGVWVSAPISDVIAGIVSFIFLNREIRRLNRAIACSGECE